MGKYNSTHLHRSGSSFLEPCAPLDHFINAANSKRMISRCRVRPANWPQPKRTLGLSQLLQRHCMRSRCTIPAYLVVYFLGCILDHQAVATRTPGNHAHLSANNWCPMCMLLVVRRVPRYKPQFFRMKGPADALRRAGSVKLTTQNHIWLRHACYEKMTPEL